MSQTKEIELWTPHEAQLEIMESDARFKVVVAGRRFGKTMLCVNRLVKQALLDEDQDYFYIAPTYRQGKQIAWDMLKTTARNLPDELVHKVNSSELYVDLGNNCSVYIKGADKPDSLRGVGLGGVVLDEYADMKPNVFSEIIRPTLVDSEGWAIFIGTPRGFNHFYDLFMEADNRNNWERFRFTTYENPHVDDAMIDEEREQMNKDKFAQEYLAEFRKREGLVYPEFDRNTHIIDDTFDRGNIVQRMAGLDFGYQNPTAFIVIYKNAEGTYFIEDEWVRQGRTNQEVTEYVKSYVEGEELAYIYPDPAEPDRIEELRRMGVPTREVNKSKGSVRSGIDRVRDKLKTKDLYVSEDCKNTISEFESYHYPDDRDTKLNKESYEKPVKEADHCMDAIRYTIFMNAPSSNAVNNQNFNLYGKDYN